MKIKKLSVLLWLLFFFCASCAIRKNLVTPYANADNKPPIDDGDTGHGTKYCSADADGKFDFSAIKIESGLAPDHSAWADAGGCVKRPIREAWAVFHNVEDMKFKAADRITFERQVNPKPDLTHIYTITYFKSTIIGTLDWTIEWHHGFDKGTFKAPLQVTINYQRVRGTSNIPVWSGGIVLTKVSNTVTSIAIHNEFKARQSTSQNEQSARDAANEMIGNVRIVKPDWDRLDSPTEILSSVDSH